MLLTRIKVSVLFIPNTSIELQYLVSLVVNFKHDCKIMRGCECVCVHVCRCVCEEVKTYNYKNMFIALKANLLKALFWIYLMR